MYSSSELSINVPSNDVTDHDKGQDSCDFNVFSHFTVSLYSLLLIGPLLIDSILQVLNVLVTQAPKL